MRRSPDLPNPHVSGGPDSFSRWKESAGFDRISLVRVFEIKGSQLPVAHVGADTARALLCSPIGDCP